MPPLWLAALAAALAAVGGMLGQWQLDRAAANRELRERYAAAAELPPVELAALPETLGEDWRYRRIEIEGEYAPERQFLLDNRVANGRVGYEVLTPFRPSAGSSWLLVNRGWLQADADRRVLPDIGVPAGRRTVVGMLDRLPRSGLDLGGAAPGGTDEPVAVVSYPTAAELAALTGRPFAELQLRLDENEPYGYLRAREPPGLPPERNVAYAFQWFLLAALCAAGAVWVLVAAWRRRMR